MPDSGELSCSAAFLSQDLVNTICWRGLRNQHLLARAVCPWERPGLLRAAGSLCLEAQSSSAVSGAFCGLSDAAFGCSCYVEKCLIHF